VESHYRQVLSLCALSARQRLTKKHFKNYCFNIGPWDSQDP
jgi:hypothetical protein